MSMQLIVSLLIALLVAGFVVWAGRKLIAVAPIDALFKSVADTLIVILAAAVVLFGVIIPLLNAVAGMHIPGVHFG